MSFTLEINMAMTLDGKVARPDGKWYGLSSREDKKRMDLIRSGADALILGKNSLVNDDPVIHLRYVEGKNPKPVILIRSGVIPKTKKVFKFAGENTPIVFCLKQNYEDLKSELSELAEIICLYGDDINPQLVVNKLIEKGLTRILLEGGPTLNYSFMKQGLVSRINVTIVPFLIGKKNLPSIVNGESEFLDFDKANWEIVYFEKCGNEVFLTYQKR